MLHWEIKGRFRKRVVLANVPSFRFSFQGNIRRNHPFGNHPFANTKKAHWEIKGRFRKRVVLADVPSFRFSFQGNIHRNHPFGNHPFANPRMLTSVVVHLSVFLSAFVWARVFDDCSPSLAWASSPFAGGGGHLFSYTLDRRRIHPTLLGENPRQEQPLLHFIHVLFQLVRLYFVLAAVCVMNLWIP